MRATITQASEVSANGTQTVVFDITYMDEAVLEGQSLSADVDLLRDAVATFVSDFKLKYLSEKKLIVGDEVEV